MNELEILKKSFRDFFSKEYLQFVIYPLIITLVVIYATFITIANISFDKLQESQIEFNTYQQTIENGQVQTQEYSYSGNSFIDFLLEYTIVSSIVGILVYLVGFIAVGYLSIFISLIVIGFLTPKILSLMHKKEYQECSFNGFGNIFDSLLFLFKTFAVAILIFFLLIPLYFIPLVNIVAINLPLYYLFQKLLHYDIGSSIFSSNNEFKLFYFTHKSNLRSKTILFYFVSLIPFVALFASVFYVIYLGHSYFSQLHINSLRIEKA